jgi:hypothetical protein
VPGQMFPCQPTRGTHASTVHAFFAAPVLALGLFFGAAFAAGFAFGLVAMIDPS